MSHRCLATVSTVIAVVALTPVFVAAQSTSTTAPPRTPWGPPDLQGVWDFRSITPMERPEELGDKTFLTEEEAANLEQETIERNERLLNRPARRTTVTDSVDHGEDGAPGFYNNFWLDGGTTTVGTRRTSLIVDPSAGKMPDLTADGQSRAAELVEIRRGAAIGPEDFSLFERCLVGFNSGPPMIPGSYNNVVQIFHTLQYVVIFNEMVHDARIVPLDGRPTLNPDVRQWLGSSRGRWEGDTLVVETTNFRDEGVGAAAFVGSGVLSLPSKKVNTSDRMKLIERFTRIDADDLHYEFTVDDPGTWVRPWTALVTMAKTSDQVYEYACHEGNYAMTNILAGTRTKEQASEKGTSKP